MNRLCVFSHWDMNNIIDDYVVYYLSALREIFQTVIFVSDTENLDLSKIEGLYDYSIVGKHGEYDFGSYKRGFLYAIENNLIFDELFFINDSCYGPFFPLKPIIEKMERKNYDFWGITKNSYRIKKIHEKNIKVIKHLEAPSLHIQSYFLAFSSKAFSHPSFIDFIKDIKKENCKEDIIIKYELGLSKLLFSLDLKFGTFINAYTHTSDPIVNKWDKLIIKYKYPFLKTSLLKKGLYFEGEIKNWKDVITKHSDYPCELMEQNYKRYFSPYTRQIDNFNTYRKIRYYVLKNLPYEVRNLLIKIEKNGYILLNAICFNKLKKF